MRLAIISDVHANLLAFQAVLSSIEGQAVTEVWCLGDTVGYGPAPQACVDLVRERATVVLSGNHDLAVSGGLSLHEFNDIAATAARWQKGQLTEDALEWLNSLSSRLEVEDLTLAHGSPRHPVWEYVTDSGTARANADHFVTQLCLIGHSHVQHAWEIEDDDGWLSAPNLVRQPPEDPLVLDLQRRWLLNPGSVGQPRDGDPRAAYAILDTELNTWTWMRVAYDIDAVSEAILVAGLPAVLGQRLHLGW